MMLHPRDISNKILPCTKQVSKPFRTVLFGVVGVFEDGKRRGSPSNAGMERKNLGRMGCTNTIAVHGTRFPHRTLPNAARPFVSWSKVSKSAIEVETAGNSKLEG